MATVIVGICLSLILGLVVLCSKLNRRNLTLEVENQALLKAIEEHLKRAEVMNNKLNECIHMTKEL